LAFKLCDRMPVVCQEILMRGFRARQGVVERRQLLKS